MFVSVIDQTQTREYFDHRADKLTDRTLTHRSGWVTENYKPGRHRCLKGKVKVHTRNILSPRLGSRNEFQEWEK